MIQLSILSDPQSLSSIGAFFLAVTVGMYYGDSMVAGFLYTILLNQRSNNSEEAGDIPDWVSPYKFELMILLGTFAGFLIGYLFTSVFETILAQMGAVLAVLIPIAICILSLWTLITG